MFQLHLNGTLTETGVAEQLSHETRSENKSKVHSFAELKYLPAFDMVKSPCWIYEPVRFTLLPFAYMT